MPLYKALPTSPTFVAPALGTPASGVMTNVTGTASGLTAGNVTTNANLTGDVTSSGNATTIGAGTVHASMLVTAPTRFVPLDNVQVFTGAGPNATFTDLDVTANTSATCYAVSGLVLLTIGGNLRWCQIRNNGSSSTAPAVYGIINTTNAGAFITGVDANQIFEYTANGTGVATLTIWLTGYWETVA